MQYSDHGTPTPKIRKNPESFDPVTLARYDTIRIPLGRYRDNQPEPQFDIAYEPALPYAATCEFIKLPLNNGSYTLTAQLQNFHSASVTVTISRRGQGDPAPNSRYAC